MAFPIALSAGTDRTARRCADPRRVAFCVAALCGCAGLLFLVSRVWLRPFGPVEAELAFQARRLQQGYALYVDPVAGAWESGPPPSRYYVLYTPLWPWLLALFSPRSLLGIRTVGRACNAVLWLVALGALVRSAKREQRLVVATGALLVLGFEMLVRAAAPATGDTPAVVLCTFGLLRATRAHRDAGLDPLSAVLLAVSPLLKPNVLGALPGAVAAHIALHRREGIRRLATPLAWGGLAAAVLIGFFAMASHGAWLEHIVRATGQPLSLDRWVKEFGSRALFLGVPHVVLWAVAASRRAPLMATLPLATSTAWATFLMAKHGSATNYWLEPTMVALVVLRVLPPRPSATLSASGDGARARPAPSRLTSGLASGWEWAGAAFTVVAAASSLAALARAPSDDRFASQTLARLRTRCPLRAGEVLISNEVVLELEANGRIVVPTWETSYLVRNGKFPLEAWRSDLDRPETRWLVHTSDILDPSPARIAGTAEVSAYRRELKDAVERNFVLDGPLDDRTPNLLVYRRR